MEGLAYGKICIATNESGADDILTNGKDGFLLPQKNTEALIIAIKKALSLNEETYNAMAVAARQTSQQFSWPRIAKQYKDFLLK